MSILFPDRCHSFSIKIWSDSCVYYHRLYLFSYCCSLRMLSYELTSSVQLLRSDIPPKEITTNAPHLLAVWEEFQYAEWPIACVSQLLDCGADGPMKVDIVACGGDEWIKINTYVFYGHLI